jgi:hypothetical protein
VTAKLILMPAALSDGTDLVPGSLCIEAGCGHLAWIAPSGIQALLRGGLGTVCHGCVDMNDASGVGVVPNADVELVEAVGAALAFTVLDAVRLADQEIRRRRDSGK